MPGQGARKAAHTAADLLQMGYVNDPLLLQDVSLCLLCSYTCSFTAKTK